MSFDPNGELIPVGGGEPIPLIRPTLTLGRRESCDIWLPYPNVSGQHCELSFLDGCWLLRDLKSTNGVKVNGVKVTKKVLHPGDSISIAKRKFTIQYTAVIGSQAMAEILEEADELMDMPLLEKAGLVKKPRHQNPVINPSLDDDDD